MPDPLTDIQPGAEPPIPSSGSAEVIKSPREHVILWTILAILVAIASTRLVKALSESLDASRLLTDILGHLCFVGILASSAVYLSRNAIGGWRRRLLFTKPDVSVVGFVSIILCNWLVQALGIPLFMLGTALLGRTELSSGVGDMFETASLASRTILIVVGTLGAGIAEEMLFRGYLQQGLLKDLRPRDAILLAALLFAGLHWPPPRAMFMVPYSIWLGVVTHRTRSIVPSIVCHALTNLTLFVALATGAEAVTLMGIGALVGVPFSFFALRALRGRK